MPKIYNSLNYRAFLKTLYEERKEGDSYFSYRYIENQTGLDASYIAKLFQEKVHLATKFIVPFAEIFNLDENELEYLEVLVAFNKSKNAEHTQLLFQKLNTFKKVKSHSLRADQLEYFQNWYTPAIRSLVATGFFDGDFKKLAQALYPPISEKEAKSSFELLKKLGMVENKNGLWKTTDQFIKLSDECRPLATRAYQKEVNKKADDAIFNCPPHLRDFSTLTLSVSENEFKEVSHRLAELRESVLKLTANAKKADRVYQLNLQWFPLAFKTLRGLK